MMYVGIDPGVTGAICFMVYGDRDQVTRINVYDCPVISGEINAKGIMQIFRNEITACSHIPGMVGIERAQAMRKEGRVQGTVSTFTIGKNYGLYIGLLHALSLPFMEIMPAVWKREFGLLKQPKDASINKVLQMLPQSSEFLKFKKHNGRADACLIAEYTRRRTHTSWNLRKGQGLTLPD